MPRAISVMVDTDEFVTHFDRALSQDKELFEQTIEDFMAVALSCRCLEC